MIKATIISPFLGAFQMSKQSRAAQRTASQILGAFALVVIMFVAGCGSSNAPTVPMITANPTNVSVTAGATATFTAAASGTPTPTVQWMVSTGGSAFSALAGATSTTLSFTTTAGQSGNTYEAVFTNAQGSATTTAATLTVNTLPVITTNPANATVVAGVTATFTAAATGSPAPTVQWQVSTNGGTTFTNVSGATATTLSFATTASQNGNQFKAVFTNAAGSTSTTAATLTVQAPALSIVKSHTGNFTAGTNGAFTIAVSNSGNIATTGPITVTDTLAAGFTFVSGTGTNWTCAAALQVVTCTNPGPIAASTVAGNITLTVAVALTAPASIANTAVAATTGSANASSTDTVTVLSPDLAIVVSHTGNFTAGQNGVFTIAVNNAGTAPTSGTITVADTLNANFSFVSAAGTGWVCGNAAQVVTCTNAGPIANGASAANITLTVLVSAATPAGNQTDTATVATSGDNNAANNSSTNTVAINAAPDLAIVKTATSNFVAGANGTFAIAVSNVAGAGSTVGAITVTDTLNANFTFVSGTGAGWSCAAAAQVVTCTNAGPIAGGASAANIVLTVAVNLAASGTITNTATVQTTDDNNALNNTSTASVTVTAAAPDLSIAKTAVGAFVPGSNGTFQIAINNIGTASTTGAITVTDTLNSAFTFVSGTGTGWTCAAASQVVTCTNPGPVANGSATGNITLTVGISGAATGSISNTATVADAGDTTDVGDKSSTASASIGAANTCIGFPTGNESMLHGQYAILLNGWQGSGNGTPVAIAASFATDGAGNIASLTGGSGGDLDINTATGGAQHSFIKPSGAGVVSTYTVGPDGTGAGFLGCAVVATGNPNVTVRFTFALGGVVSGVASKGRVIEFDDTTGAGIRAAGEMRLQDATAFSMGNTTGLHTNYAFGEDGFDSTGHFAIAGSIVLNPATGAITGGSFDEDDAGTLQNNVGVTGNIPFTSVSAIDGRATLSITVSAFTTNVAIYEVNANEFFTIGTDSFNLGNPISTGRAIVSAASYTSAAIAGNQMLHLAGQNTCNISSVQTPCGSASIGLLNFTAGTATTGTITGDIYNYDIADGAQAENFPSATPATFTLTGSTGRMTVANAGTHPPVFYLASPAANTDPVTAFIVGTDSSGLFGTAEAGATAAITTSSLAGNYFVGNEDMADNTVKNQMSVDTVAANGTISGTGDQSGQNGLQTNKPTNGTITITNLGSASNSAPGTGNVGPQTIAITNGKRLIFIDESGGPASVIIVELQ
jgi:uncharacterized repeat protein (TIGR01451 family)